MDLAYGPEHEALRDEVRGFLTSRHALWPEVGATRARVLAWQKRLIEHGYAARTIPRRYGGHGGEPDILASRIIAEEFIRAGAPGPLADQGISMLVPTLLEMGSEEQKPRWIAPPWPARSSGARAIRSRAPAPTWPPSRPGPTRTATTS